MGGRREYGARPSASGELPLRLQREAPRRRLGQRQVLRADAPAALGERKAGTALPTLRAIAPALRTETGLAAAAPRAIRHRPVVDLPVVETAIADWHRGGL